MVLNGCIQTGNTSNLSAMTIALWLTVVSICLLGAMSPGPSLAVVLQQTLGGGRKNGIIAAVVSPSDHATMVEATERAPAAEVTVDLEAGRIESAAFDPIEFEVEPFARHCLLNGLDQFGYLLDLQAQIEDYEAKHPQRVSTLQRTPR